MYPIAVLRQAFHRGQAPPEENRKDEDIAGFGPAEGEGIMATVVAEYLCRTCGCMHSKTWEHGKSKA